MSENKDHSVGEHLDSCTCAIWGIMDFHVNIFVCRKKGDVDLYDETLVDSKW